MGFTNGIPDAQYEAIANGSFVNGEVSGHSNHMVNGQGPQPGTNAYVNANIPMTMNGVAMFGELPKKGRSKACYECRKSKVRTSLFYSPIHSANETKSGDAYTMKTAMSILTKQRSHQYLAVLWLPKSGNRLMRAVVLC